MSLSRAAVRDDAFLCTTTPPAMWFLPSDLSTNTRVHALHLSVSEGGWRSRFARACCFSKAWPASRPIWTILGWGSWTNADAAAAATLGLQFIDIDADRGVIELAFEARRDFTNPMGNVLGGHLAAVLYDTVGPALLATLGADQFQSTLDLNVRFLRAVRPGRIAGKGCVVHRTGDIPS